MSHANCKSSHKNVPSHAVPASICSLHSLTSKRCQMFWQARMPPLCFLRLIVELLFSLFNVVRKQRSNGVFIWFQLQIYSVGIYVNGEHNVFAFQVVVFLIFHVICLFFFYTFLFGFHVFQKNMFFMFAFLHPVVWKRTPACFSNNRTLLDLI